MSKKQTALGRSVKNALAAFAITGASLGSVFSASAQAGETYTNSIGMEFVAIPAGSFLMGSGDDVADAQASEQPQHEVTISRGYSIGRYEVTQAQWEAVIGSNPYDRNRLEWPSASRDLTIPRRFPGTMRRNSSVV